MWEKYFQLQEDLFNELSCIDVGLTISKSQRHRVREGSKVPKVGKYLIRYILVYRFIESMNPTSTPLPSSPFYIDLSGEIQPCFPGSFGIQIGSRSYPIVFSDNRSKDHVHAATNCFDYCSESVVPGGNVDAEKSKAVRYRDFCM